MNARFHPVCPASQGTLKIPVPPAVKLAAATGARPALDPDVIAAEIVEDFQTALAQLKLARCPQSLTPSLAALPSMSLIPFTPMIRSRPRGSSVTLTDLTVHLARARSTRITKLFFILIYVYPYMYSTVTD